MPPRGNIRQHEDGGFRITTLDTLPAEHWPSSSVRVGALGVEGGGGTMTFRCTAEECAAWFLKQEFDH